MISEDDGLAAVLARAIPRRRQYIRRNPDLESKVLKLAALGIPVATIARTIGVPAPTINSSWTKADPAFALALADAVATGRKLNSDIAIARSAAGERRLQAMVPRRAA